MHADILYSICFSCSNRRDQTLLPDNFPSKNSPKDNFPTESSKTIPNPENSTQDNFSLHGKCNGLGKR